MKFLIKSFLVPNFGGISLFIIEMEKANCKAKCNILCSTELACSGFVIYHLFLQLHGFIIAASWIYYITYRSGSGRTSIVTCTGTYL